jgi:hypothetical protein
VTYLISSALLWDEGSMRWNVNVILNLGLLNGFCTIFNLLNKLILYQQAVISGYK